MTNYELISLIISALGAAFVGGSVILLAKQLKLVATAHADNHEWNRRYSTEQALSKVRDSKDTGILNKKFLYINHPHPIPLEKITSVFENKPELQPALHNLLNLYEGLANGIHLGTYDDLTVKTNRRTVMESTLTSFRHYIQHRRDGTGRKAWVGLERLIDDWKKIDLESNDRPTTGKI